MIFLSHLWDGHGWVSVVQLYGDLLGHSAEVSPGDLLRTKLGMFEPPDHIAESGSTEEVFLLQAEFFSFKEVVVRIQHARDVLGEVPVHHRLKISNFWLFFFKRR